MYVTTEGKKRKIIAQDNKNPLNVIMERIPSSNHVESKSSKRVQEDNHYYKFKKEVKREIQSPIILSCESLAIKSLVRQGLPTSIYRQKHHGINQQLSDSI